MRYFCPFFACQAKKVPKFRGLPRNFCPFFACCAKKCLNFAVNYEIFGFKWQQNLRCLASHNQLFRYSGSMRRWRQVRAFVFRIFSSLFRSLKARPSLRRVGFNSENFAINCEICAFFSQKFRSSTRNLTIFSGFFLGYQFWPLFFDAKKKEATRLIHITSFLISLSCLIKFQSSHQV